jgi:hypothetical protein
MHTATIKITCDGSFSDTSAAGLSDLLCGIDGGQVDGSVEVVEGPVEVIAPEDGIRERLLAVLDIRPKAIVPVLAERLVALSTSIVPDMSDGQIHWVRDELLDCADVAAQYGRSDLSASINHIARELEACHAS